MFERAVLVPRKYADTFEFGAAFDYGQLAEALVFFDHVHLVGTPVELGALIQNVGADPVLELMSADRLSAVPISLSAGHFMHGGSYVVQDHGLSWSLAGLDMLEENLRSIDTASRQTIVDTVGAGPASKLDGLLANKSWKKQIRQSRAIVGMPSILAAARSMLDAHNPGQAHWVSLRENGLYIDENLGSGLPGQALGAYGFGIRQEPFSNFDELHQLRLAGLELLPYVPEQLINELSQFAASLEAAAHLNAEFAVDAAYSAGIASQIASAAPRASLEELALFQAVIFNDAKAIGAPVTGVSLAQRREGFLKLARLLAEKERFSTWMRSQSLNTHLISNYMHYMQRGTWLDSLPGKILRFVVFTGAGIAFDEKVGALTGIQGLGTAAGVGIGAVDSFLLDKLRGGWRPSQFVSGPLADWVKGSGPLPGTA